VNGIEFTTGTLAGSDVVIFLSGISMINAAMNTQLVVDHFNVTHIIYSGIAGGVNPALNIGDVIVPAQWGQYQEMLYAREVADGDYAPPPWAATPYPNYGMMFPQTVNVRTEDAPEGTEKFWFEVDAEMLAVAETVADSMTLAECNAEGVCLTSVPRIVVGGNGVSGQTFVDNADFREYAFATFEADVLDMETAATAMVAYANSVPFIAFRSLSDLAGGGPGENEIGTFFQVAADNSAAVVIAFLEAWSAR
jgi:adenosylhomocysteine nucleosidase